MLLRAGLWWASVLLGLARSPGSALCTAVKYGETVLTAVDLVHVYTSNWNQSVNRKLQSFY